MDIRDSTGTTLGTSKRSTCPYLNKTLSRVDQTKISIVFCLVNARKTEKDCQHFLSQFFFYDIY